MTSMERSNTSFVFSVMLLLIAIDHSSGSIFQPLSDYISSKIQPYVVPMNDPSEPLAVTLLMRVYAIDEVDRRRNQLHIRSWLMEIWNSSITWDPKDYNGLTTMRLPTAKGFVPHVSTMASAGHYETLSPLETRYFSNGEAIFFVKVRWRVSCDLTEADTCTIKMYSTDYCNGVIRFSYVENYPVNMDLFTDSIWDPKHKIVSENYSHGKEKLDDYPRTPGWVQYKFSFREKRPYYNNYNNGPMATFRWY